jgi:hypothetical protein
LQTALLWRSDPFTRASIDQSASPALFTCASLEFSCGGYVFGVPNWLPPAHLATL